VVEDGPLMGATGTITCTMCRKGIPVEFKRVSNAADGTVAMLMGMAPLEAHMRVCAAGEHPKAVAAPELSVPPVELAGRIDRLLNARTPRGGRYFVATGGSRACSMCGMAGASCLSLVGQNTREACCPACANGNTHPAPGEAQGSCAQWAVENGAKS
jgi:hypothetical protein